MSPKAGRQRSNRRNRQRSPVVRQAAPVAAAAVDAAPQPAAAAAATPPISVRRPAARPASAQVRDFSYVRQDLKRIAITAGIMVVLIVAAYFILG